MKITMYELLGMVKDGKLKDGTKIRCSDFPATYVYKNGTLGFYGAEEFIELTLRDILENINYANYEILEEEKKTIDDLNLSLQEIEAFQEARQIFLKLNNEEDKQTFIKLLLGEGTYERWIDYLKGKGDK